MAATGRRHGGGAFSGKDRTKADPFRRVCRALGRQERGRRRSGRLLRSRVPNAIGVSSPSQSWPTPSVPRMLPRTRSSRPVEKTRPAPGRNHPRPRPASPHLRKDLAAYGHFGRRRRLHLGENRQGRRAQSSLRSISQRQKLQPNRNAPKRCVPDQSVPLFINGEDERTWDEQVTSP